MADCWARREAGRRSLRAQRQARWGGRPLWSKVLTDRPRFTSGHETVRLSATSTGVRYGGGFAGIGKSCVQSRRLEMVDQGRSSKKRGTAGGLPLLEKPREPCLALPRLLRIPAMQSCTFTQRLELE
jgi:hypothetical protein